MPTFSSSLQILNFTYKHIKRLCVTWYNSQVSSSLFTLSTTPRTGTSSRSRSRTTRPRSPRRPTELIDGTTGKIDDGCSSFAEKAIYRGQCGPVEDEVVRSKAEVFPAWNRLRWRRHLANEFAPSDHIAVVSGNDACAHDMRCVC